MAEKKHENLIAKAVRTIQANERHSGAKTKKRGEISGGGKKPWRQKGTGRARAGSNRSPIWRGGGVVFGPTGIENHSLKINKKEKELALKAAYETQKKNVLSLDLPKASKTKEAAEFLKKNDITGKVLILVDVKNEERTEAKEVKELKRVFKNIPNAKTMVKGTESVVDVLWANKIVVLAKAQKAAKATSKEAK